jgi:hypothetical protein
MATHVPAERFALRPVFDRRLPDGTWWPESRRLSDQPGRLFSSWPPAEGRIARVRYPPPDWDDRPRSVVVVPGRRIKTGSFPRDDTHQLTLSLIDGRRRSIRVIPPDTRVGEAKEELHGGRGRADRRTSGRGDLAPTADHGGRSR